MRQAINPAAIVTGINTVLLLEMARNGRVILDDFAIVIHDPDGAVRPVQQSDGMAPTVTTGGELRALLARRADQLQRRVETHIFLCVIAYHLLMAIEKTFLDQAIHTSWATLREQLSTHQVVTTVLPTSDGNLLKIRRATTPEPEHRLIYRVLAIPEEVMTPLKTWLPAQEVVPQG